MDLIARLALRRFRVRTLERAGEMATAVSRSVAGRVRTIGTATVVVACVAVFASSSLASGDRSVVLRPVAGTGRVSPGSLQDALAVLQLRLRRFELTGASVRLAARDRIVLTVSAGEDPRALARLLGMTGKIRAFDFDRHLVPGVPQPTKTEPPAKAGRTMLHCGRIVKFCFPSFERGVWFQARDLAHPEIPSNGILTATARPYLNTLVGAWAVQVQLRTDGSRALRRLVARLAAAPGEAGTLPRIGFTLDDEIATLIAVFPAQEVPTAKSFLLVSETTKQNASRIATVVSTGPLPFALSPE